MEVLYHHMDNNEKRNNNSKKNLDSELIKRESLRLSNEESNKLTRECVRTALILLINDTHFDKITTTAIIKKSGVSRAGFYRNYSSKNDVILEIAKELSDKMTKNFDNARHKENPQLVFLDIFSEIKTDKKYFEIYLKSKQTIDFLLPLEFKTKTRENTGTCLQKYANIAASTALSGIIDTWIATGMKESPKEMADICNSIFQVLLHLR